MVARVRRAAYGRDPSQAARTLAQMRVLALRSPNMTLAGTVADILITGNLVARWHALRIAVPHVESFADVVSSNPSEWTVPSIVNTALQFLADKNAMTPQQYAAMRDTYRAAGFTIAGETEADVLDRALQSLQRSARLGLSADDAGAALNRSLRAAGYDQLRPWHARLVAQMNYASAYGAGSWEQLHDPRIRGIIPAYRYVTMRDERVRPAHRAMEGHVAARTDPIWNTWWPPNGYNCRCRVIGVNASAWELRGGVSNRWPMVDDEGEVVDRGGEAVMPDEAGDSSFDGNPSLYLKAKARRR
jgi:SPP1 gp7 family putative phage head morphogenesis protein